MTRRHYANQAPQLTLAANINNSVTSLTVSGSFSGWPVSYPYFAALELGEAGLEIVSVTGVVGSVATVVRGQDGTSGVSHSAGATLDFVVVAQDHDEANAHVNATSGVHGTTSDVVGKDDAQTLTNKTLSSPTLDGVVAADTAAFSNITVTDAVLAGGTVESTADRVTGNIRTRNYTDATARDTAYTALGGAVAGDIASLDTGAPGGLQGLYHFDGTAWRPAAQASGLTLLLAGTVSITPTPNTPTSFALTFPTAFTTIPTVTVAINGTVPGTVITGVSVSGISTTGCTIWVTRTNNTATTVSWIAVQ